MICAVILTWYRERTVLAFVFYGIMVLLLLFMFSLLSLKDEIQFGGDEQDAVSSRHPTWDYVEVGGRIMIYERWSETIKTD